MLAIPQTKRNYGPEVLRGIAILMVVIYHAFTPLYGANLPWNGWFRDIVQPPTREFLWFYPVSFGWTGVSLFFVLSGFCIHLSFLRSNSFKFFQFFWRRFWRIYPVYFLAVLVFFFFANHTGLWERSGLKHLLTHVFLVHNFTAKTFFGINPSFWSIAVEVQLYLLFPFLLAIRSRWGIAHCLTITLIIGLFWRALTVYCLGLPDHPLTAALTFPLATWFDWTLGAYVAERFFQHRQAFTRRPLLLCFFIPAFISSTLYKPLTVFSFSLAAIVFAIILDAALQVHWKKSFGSSALAFIGVISYSLYLWHQPYLWARVMGLMNLTNSMFLAWCLMAVALILGSWLSFLLIEQVSIRMGDRLWSKIKPGNSKAVDRSILFQKNSTPASKALLPHYE